MVDAPKEVIDMCNQNQSQAVPLSKHRTSQGLSFQVYKGRATGETPTAHDKMDIKQTSVTKVASCNERNVAGPGTTGTRAAGESIHTSIHPYIHTYSHKYIHTHIIHTYIHT